MTTITSPATGPGAPPTAAAAHGATERPWLDELAAALRDTLKAGTIVSDRDTDPWTVPAQPKEPSP